MKIKNMGGKNVVVKVLPKEVKHLPDEEIVIVSRTCLNAKLAFMGMKIDDNETVENMQIIRGALNGMMDQEKRQKTMVKGAKMTVANIKKIFPDIENMPKNSFAQIKA